MIYVSSDLHGCSLPSFLALLDRAGFQEEDFLFILGDVIDRGDHGTELLLWLTEQPNVQLILGNHEAMLLSCDFLFRTVDEDSLESLTMENISLMQNWLHNGASPTLFGLRRLLKTDPELVEGILDYLQDCPLYERVRCGGREFLLVHAGLEDYRPDRPLSDYSPDELLWARPDPDTRYSDRFLTIFGHTPTRYLIPGNGDRAIRTDTWICIDTGAACGASPMLLRLDDLTEYY